MPASALTRAIRPTLHALVVLVFAGGFWAAPARAINVVITYQLAAASGGVYDGLPTLPLSGLTATVVAPLPTTYAKTLTGAPRLVSFKFFNSVNTFTFPGLPDSSPDNSGISAALWKTPGFLYFTPTAPVGSPGSNPSTRVFISNQTTFVLFQLTPIGDLSPPPLGGLTPGIKFFAQANASGVTCVPNCTNYTQLNLVAGSVFQQVIGQEVGRVVPEPGMTPLVSATALPFALYWGRREWRRRKSRAPRRQD